MLLPRHNGTSSPCASGEKTAEADGVEPLYGGEGEEPLWAPESGWESVERPEVHSEVPGGAKRAYLGAHEFRQTPDCAETPGLEPLMGAAGEMKREALLASLMSLYHFFPTLSRE